MLTGSEGFAAAHSLSSVESTAHAAGLWKRRAWGLAIALSDEGHFSWEDLRQALLVEQRAPLHSLEPTDGWSHCQRWLCALARVVQHAGLVDVGAIAQLGDWADSAAALEAR
jgi:Nitrile hydratase beta subunit